MDMTFQTRVQQFSSLLLNSLCLDGAARPLALEAGLVAVMQELVKLKENGRILYIIGNGGSAAVASHALVDFTNVAKLHAEVLHEGSLLTCMANDYGYEQVFSRVLEGRLKAGDMLVAISSSGRSRNICAAAETARALSGCVVTFSGFAADNPLRTLGDFNFWIDSCDYGFVEVGHQCMLHNLSDRFHDVGALAVSAAHQNVLATI